jgi:hypothetical protein
MDEQRLFRGAVDAFTVTAFRDARGYWFLHVKSRRSGESWDESEAVEYELMTTGELEDTLTATVSVVLSG